ncbi:hypothetical protein FisN_10Lh179 [Fistulifera solaris]|uniref:Uncharacterized protein n=1 Tax=Fistulifera solaris TaxID=1519565 RepID=A0A1Z5JTG1_FISSO|nr:hypothetical protein FisN_10Lh179 [Fistulifera solaris]|eukprot:GAX17315.1 hypothetical protein FisN_10Lh179 [Fistulifera solaris]
MKIASAYSLFIVSLCVLPSAYAGVRSRSLVRGVPGRVDSRSLEETTDGDGEETGTEEPSVEATEMEETETEGTEREETDTDDAETDEEKPEMEEEEYEDDDEDEESPIAPKRRDCRTRHEANGVTFECKATSDDANAKVKDEIDYTVETSDRGLMVRIKYEQEIEVEENEADEGSEGKEEDEAEGESDAEPEDEEMNEPSANGDYPDESPNADEEMAERPEIPPPSEEANEEESVEGERLLQAEQETETEFEVVYDSIIEYTKGSGSTTGEAYDWENDVVLQTISLNTWNVMSEVATDGQTSRFNVSSPDDTTAFTFTINQAADGQRITANKMKIDFELNNFPWTSDESFVALLSTVETERTVDVEYGQDVETEGGMAPKDIFISFADVVDTSSFTPFGKYSWAETAEATSTGPSNNPIDTDDSTNTTTIESSTNETEIMSSRSVNTSSTASAPHTIKVVATSPLVERADRRAQEGKQVESIAYSFVGGNAAHRASRIYWDPSAGVDYQSSARPLSLAMAGAGLVLALFTAF